MNLAHLLVRTARRAGDSPAVYLGEALLHDYATLARRAAALAGALRERYGLEEGERVGLFMGNDPAVLEIYFACWWAGLAVVPINPKLHVREAHYILAHSQAALAFASQDIGAALAGTGLPLPDLRELLIVEQPAYADLLRGEPLAGPVPRGGDDLAWLFYPSGTTGRPKGVMITHRNLMTMTLCYFADVDAIDARDATLYAAPTMVRRLVEHAAANGEDGNGLKTVIYGGGPMYVEDIVRALKVLGPRFVQIYGQGESPMTITALSRAQLAAVDDPHYLERLGSVGVAQSAVELRVGDADGRDLPLGETGEVLVRGDSVMAGYWRDPVATAATIRGGWLFTGDLGQLDASGFLTLRDRSKDVIISGGSNIYPREVEEALLHHADVAEVSVVGRPDPEWGEVVVAFVVARAPAQLQTAELDAVCGAHIARFKRPREYHLVEALPKNHYGKVLKTELRARLAAQ